MRTMSKPKAKPNLIEITEGWIKKTTGKSLNQMKEELDQKKKQMDNLNRLMESLKIREAKFEETKRLIKSGHLKVERFFNDICNENPTMNYQELQFVCCDAYGMPKDLFAKYKNKRKNNLGDFRDEPYIDKTDKQKILSLLEYEPMTLEEISKELKIPFLRVEATSLNLIKAKRVTKQRRRSANGQIEQVIMVKK